MKKITATVAWFTSVEVEVDENLSYDEVREKIFTKAESVFDSLKNRPVIHGCTDTSLID